jgi:hypothetical protein
LWTSFWRYCDSTTGREDSFEVAIGGGGGGHETCMRGRGKEAEMRGCLRPSELRGKVKEGRTVGYGTEKREASGVRQINGPVLWRMKKAVESMRCQIQIFERRKSLIDKERGESADDLPY